MILDNIAGLARTAVDIAEDWFTPTLRLGVTGLSRSGKTVFTTADNFVVQIHRPLEEPLRTLVVASSLAVDTALKQDSRGLS